jgi:hypothetical protein
VRDLLWVTLTLGQGHQVHWSVSRAFLLSCYIFRTTWAIPLRFLWMITLVVWTWCRFINGWPLPCFTVKRSRTTHILCRLYLENQLTYRGHILHGGPC